MYVLKILFDKTDLSFLLLAFWLFLISWTTVQQIHVMIFLWFIIFQIIFFGVLVIIFELLIVDLFVCIYSIRVHWSWKFSSSVIETLCGPYPNWTYAFASPTGLWKAMVRVTVGCSDPFSKTDCFYWYKTSFKSFVQAFFLLLLMCMYNFFGIIINWSWKFSLNVIENCQLDVSKLYIWIYSPHRFVEGFG